ncbi:MAG: RDD family protein [Candidatus Methylomirabilales bacterium]
MRCPACGFVSFDSFSTCKQCGKELPRQGKPGGIIAPARPESGPPPSAEEPPARGPLLQDAEEVAEAALPDVAVEVVPTEPTSLRTAGFWLRSVAFLVDGGMVVLLATGGAMLVDLAVQIGGLISSAPEAGLEWLDTTATSLLVVLIVLCYFTLFVGFRGQTPGKMLLGLKIIRTTGEEVGYGSALVRWIAQCLSLLPLGLGFLMIAFSRRKQGLHDKLARTYVVRIPS